MNTTKALAWNTGVQIAGKIISTAIGVIVVSLMTRYLGTTGFGLYSTANSYFQIFAIILDFGLNITLVQMLGEKAGNAIFENKLTSAIYTLRIISAGFLLTAAAFLGLILPYPWELKLAFFGIWGSFFFTALNQIVIGVQQRHLKMHVVALGEVIGRFILLGGVICAMLNGWGLVAIVSIVSIGSTANFLVNILIAKKYASFAWNWDPELWKIVLHRSWPIGISIIFNLLYYKADSLILSYVRPFSEVGVYSAAYRVLEILVTLPFMYCGVLLPMISNAWANKNTKQFQELLSNSFTTMFLLAAPMVAGTVIIGDRIMSFVAGNDFIASGDILKILMLAVGMIFIGTVSSHAIVALNKQKYMLRWYIMIAVVTCAGYLLFIPIYGMYAAAWLTVFAETCVTLVTTFIALKTSNTHINLNQTVKISVCAIIMALIILPFKQNHLIIPILIGSIVYGILILIAGVISKDTIRAIFSIRKGIPTADNT
ncbi:flippase [Candidatus Uhrbacteria bacterium]|nr:flippase [Candidatus Uhrbacteria bacterium]